jgi:hypothetical protein
MDLKKYLERFKSTMGALTVALAALPLLSEVLPGKASEYAFPPLGTYQLLWSILAAAVAALVILLVYFLARGSSYVSQHDKRVRAFVLMGVFVGLGIIAYFVAVQVVVREVSVPTQKKTVGVSVGFERTELANREFAGRSDWFMLENMGLGEEQIHKLWTLKSLLLSRSLLFAAYLFALSIAVSLCSFAVLCDVFDNP